MLAQAPLVVVAGVLEHVAHQLADALLIDAPRTAPGRARLNPDVLPLHAQMARHLSVGVGPVARLIPSTNPATHPAPRPASQTLQTAPVFEISAKCAMIRTGG